ncbi:hypothetical protein NE865_11007 [Phthorimaea operculella]|nr:hypothetical protein NE865_11007 [Phthorimaea operculella]
MFVRKTFILFVSSVFLFCEAGFVDNLEKCSITDTSCMRDVIQSVIRDTSKTGIPEYDIPPYDPYVVSNERVSVLNLVDVTLVEGNVKGIRNCVVNKFDVNFKKGKARLELTCDVKIKGKYRASGEAEIIKTLLGGSSVHGEGNAKVVIDKFHMKTEYKFYVRNRNGELYIDCQRNDTKTHIDIGKISFAADNLYLGDTEASAFITNIMNNNWKFIMDNAGKPFLDRAGDVIHSEIRKFFIRVPTKFFVADDLSQFVRE